jgi:hypothetical protein
MPPLSTLLRGPQPAGSPNHSPRGLSGRPQNKAGLSKTVMGVLAHKFMKAKKPAKRIMFPFSINRQESSGRLR